MTKTCHGSFAVVHTAAQTSARIQMNINIDPSLPWRCTSPKISVIFCHHQIKGQNLPTKCPLSFPLSFPYLSMWKQSTLKKKGSLFLSLSVQKSLYRTENVHFFPGSCYRTKILKTVLKGIKFQYPPIVCNLICQLYF